MKAYKVGGCVRDKLLGLTPKDIDYVVVGATEQEMLDRGFTKVGADFPVFLHPTTHDEWALARKERKTGVGYNGFDVVFDPTVTLEEDLARRDLTINAMAQDIFTDEIIDPFGGRRDLEDGLLRHVSAAFAEDPVRVLRTARFVARYTSFTIARSTLRLMNDIAEELNHVPQERIWAEFEKGLGEDLPVAMFMALKESGALFTDALIPYSGLDFEALCEITKTTPMCARFTACATNFKKEDYDRCRIPAEYARVAQAFYAARDTLAFYQFRLPKARIELFTQLRAFSSPELLDSVLEVWKLYQSKGFDPRILINEINKDLSLLGSVDTAGIAANCSNGKEIAGKILEARIAALEAS